MSYLYEPFNVYDFAFDPTVINSIVQPSSLVLGYVYRPYTAHSAVVGLIYVVVVLAPDSSHREVHARTVSSLTARFGRRARRALGAAPVPAADDAQIKKGAGGLRGAEVPDVPCHRRQGQQDQPPRRRRQEAVGGRHQEVDRTPVEMTAQTKSTKKPPMPAKYGTLPAADLDALVAYLQSLK